MNDLGGLLLGIAARGTVFAGVGLALGWALRRRGPAASATVVLATLVGLVGVSALGAAPWPRWWTLDGGRSATAAAQADDPAPARPAVVEAGSPSGIGDGPGGISAGPTIRDAEGPADPGIGAAIRALALAMMEPTTAAERPGTAWGWRAWVAAAGLAGVGLGLGRFALGLLAVAALRRGSRPLTDPSMLGLARRLGDELGVTADVAIRVAPGLTTPATVGWLRPAIFVPEDWSAWDDRERGVVLAHELAHIRRQDYLSGLGAQLSLALHYYHPLAHWLAYRLRLEQELAADAWGARVSGGNRPYLAALARLALRSDPRPVGWPARSIRPVQGTFLRRIEMLRDANEIPQSPLPRRSRALALGGLALAGLALAGLRGPGPMKSAVASTAQAPAANPPASQAASLAFVPADAAAIAVLRPADLLARPDLKALFESMQPPNDRIEKRLGFAPTDIEQATFVWVHGAPDARNQRGPLVPPPSGTIVRMTKAQDWKGVITHYIGPEAQEVRFNDYTYSRSTRGAVIPGHCAAATDDRTLVLAEEGLLIRMLLTRPGAADGAVWAGAWKAIKPGQVAGAFDSSWLLGKFLAGASNGGRPVLPGGPLGPFSPLLDRAHAHAIAIDLGKTIAIDGVALGNSDEGAQAVADTLRAAITLGRNSLDSVRARGGDVANSPQAAMRPFAEAASQLLARANVTVEGRTVRLAASGDATLVNALRSGLVPAAAASRAAAMRAQSVNNLKQIGLAFHRYHHVKGKLPASANLGPDGKTPHSWRVAILPFIEQNDLYNQYKLNEPWDSPSNLKLIEKMPAIYAHPQQGRGSSPSYYVISGPGAVFNGSTSLTFDKLTDGTTNTILAVEAARETPWTKPEDIAFDPNGAPPKLGGLSANGFNTLFTDGSVRFIGETINPIVLKALMTANGGEVISNDSIPGR